MIIPSQTEAHAIQEKSTLNSKDLKGFLKEVSLQYGQNYEMMTAVIQCESTWGVTAYNEDDEKFVPGGSFGIAQFTIPTFEENCSGDYKDPLDQLSCMGLLWKRGEQKRWMCYRKLFGN